MNLSNSSHILRRITIATLALWIPLATYATTRYVWQDSPNPTVPYTNWATAAHVIQHAIDTATNGDTVLVTNGVYSPITVYREITVESVNGAWHTIIDAQSGGRCATTFGGLAVAAIKGFTLRNGRASSGAGAIGGALYNCTLSSNWAGDGGGAAYCTLYNSVLTGNMANGDGGGVYEGNLFNCTLTGNSAAVGGGVYAGSLYNCIVYHNTASYGRNYNYSRDYGTSTFSYSCSSPLPPGEGNIDADPLLASSTHLSAGSPCVAAGNPAHATGVDIEGEPWQAPPSIGADQFVFGQSTGSLNLTIEGRYTRVATGFAVPFTAQNQGSITSSVWNFGDGTVVSNQAFVSHHWTIPGNYFVTLSGYNDSYPSGVSVTTVVEVAEQPVAYVNRANTTPQFPYDTWEKAAVNIQEATGADSLAGRLVLVADGVYDQGGVALSETMINRIVLTNAVVVQSLNGPATTVIQGKAAHGGGTGDGAIRCAYVGADAVLNGFTLTNGHTRATGDSEQQRSGGGALCAREGILTNCIVSGNSAFADGGGVHGGRLYRCLINGNKATDDGGGVDESILYNCTLTGNWAKERGGGADDSTLYGCFVTGNAAIRDAGGAYESELYHCTVTRNSARKGGGINNSLVFNSIVYNNKAPVGQNYYWDNSVFPLAPMHYSCTDALPDRGIGNIAADPQFASASHLSGNSPCIGTGSSAYAFGVDIDGTPWSDPPCIGADQVVPGGSLGALAVAIDAEYTEVAVGFGAPFGERIEGQVTRNQWEFGDGTIVTNQLFLKHAWAAAGTYPVVLTAFNDANPAGVSATVFVQVVNVPVFYVNCSNAAPRFPYQSWADAATSIQDAIGASMLPGRRVEVTNGVYDSGGVAMVGLMTNRVALTNAVVVRSVNGPWVTLIQGASAPGGDPGDGAIRCAFVGAHSVLSGFTLTNGYTRVSGDKTLEQSGGGAWCETEGILTNCVIRKNAAAEDAGGVQGGVLYQCYLAQNTAEDDGGGAEYSLLYNCELFDNQAKGQGGGGDECVFYNCVVYWNNMPIPYYPFYNPYGDNHASSTFYFSCTHPMPQFGVGNITNFPAFGYGSALIDAGTNLSHLISTDFYGHPRPLDGDGDGIAAFDIGASEFDLRTIVPTNWFIQYGLDPSDPHVVSHNPDNDPFTTFQEWQADTNPTNAQSYFRIEAISNGPPAILHFPSSSNRVYSLLSATNLTDASWTTIPGQTAIPGSGRMDLLCDTNAGPEKYYRVRVQLP